MARCSSHEHGGFWLLTVVVGLVAAGCGTPDARVECSGSISFAGEPLEEGSISFQPLTGGSRSEGAVIAAGRYTARVLPGRYRVEIRGSRPIADAGAIRSDMPGEIREDFVPPQYNDKSTLEATIPPDGSSELSFDLPAAG